MMTMVIVFNATFNNISVVSWRSILLLEKTGVPGENHRPVVKVSFSLCTILVQISDVCRRYVVFHIYLAHNTNENSRSNYTSHRESPSPWSYGRWIKTLCNRWLSPLEMWSGLLTVWGQLHTRFYMRLRRPQGITQNWSTACEVLHVSPATSRNNAKLAAMINR